MDYSMNVAWQEKGWEWSKVSCMNTIIDYLEILKIYLGEMLEKHLKLIGEFG